MSHFSHTEIVMKAAGVKIVTSLPEKDVNNILTPGNYARIILTVKKVNDAPDGRSYGFHLTKSKWDPYPWIGYVEHNSPADLAGFRAGDCLLGIDDIDLVGLKVKEIATLIRNEKDGHDIKFSVWRCPDQKAEQNNIGLALKGPLPTVARNLANALSDTVRTLECPICLESAAPPVSQCVHGHIVCVVCRPKTTRCPVCRVRLGQGRCLLADKLHRVFHDTFNINHDETVDRSIIPDRYSLRDQLFGENSKKQESPRNNCITSKPRQFLLAKLLGNREKAASADNLIRMSEISEGMPVIPRVMNINSSLLVRLCSNDRTKSASTGELSRDTVAHTNDTSSQNTVLRNDLSATNASRQTLSLPETPLWGGSLDSMSCVQLACPLFQSCKEVVTSDFLLEHIRTHAIPQVHFHSGNVKIPLPLPFGCDAFYILYFRNEMFFFQYGEESAWMTYLAKMTYASNIWEWTLHGWGDDGTEIQLRRRVASLEDPVTLSSQHIAPLPNALLIKMINIQISEYRSHDELHELNV